VNRFLDVTELWLIDLRRHSEITAFLASLSKVCSIFTTGLIPPNVNLARRNPDIHWDKYRLRVASEITHLPRQSSTEPSLVAMTSSGIGGANGSCIIEGPPLTKRHSLPSFWRVGVSVPQLLIAGGLSPRSAEAVIESLKTQTLVKSLDDLALTYGRRARSMTWRAFSIVDCAREETKFSKPILSTKNQQPVIFVFSGQGPQHLHSMCSCGYKVISWLMLKLSVGREMYRTCRSFRETVDEMDAVYERITGKSLIRDWGLFGDSVATQTLLPQDIWPISVTLPSLTVIHCALFDALTNLGVIPAALIGHSAGETAVLYASGAGSKAMVLELSIARGKAMTILESKDGAMAAVNSAPEHVLDIITSTIAELGPAPLEIGCFNALDAVTLSGSAAHVDRAVQKAKDLGIFAAKLRTRVPVHSAMMDLCEDEYRSLVANVFSRHRLRAPDIPVYSSATGRLLDVPLDAEYFWLNTRHAVRFTDAVEALAANYSEPTFIELGPHPVLTSYLTSLVPSHTSVVCPLRRPNLKKGELDVEVESLLVALGQLITVGHNCVNIAMLVDPKAQLLQEAPSYPFNPKEVPYWVSSVDVNRYTQDRHGPLNYRHMRVNASTHPSLAQHVIKGEPIMPAAAYIEMASSSRLRKHLICSCDATGTRVRCSQTLGR
jgi:acyl transferase domain-containing protein